MKTNNGMDEKIQDRQNEVREKLVKQYTEFRKSKNLTQEELAQSMGIKRPNISRFEKGQCNPTLDLLVKMAESMDLELEITLVDKKEREGSDDKNE